MWWNTCSSLSCKTSLSHNAIYLPKVSIIVSITALTVATVLQWAMYIGRNASPAKILTSIKSTMVLCSNCFCISIRWLTQIRCMVYHTLYSQYTLGLRYTSPHMLQCALHRWKWCPDRTLIKVQRYNGTSAHLFLPVQTGTVLTAQYNSAIVWQGTCSIEIRSSMMPGPQSKSAKIKLWNCTVHQCKVKGRVHLMLIAL